MIVDAGSCRKVRVRGQKELRGHSIAQKVLCDICHRFILAADGHVIRQCPLHACGEGQAGKFQASVGLVQ